MTPRARALETVARKWCGYHRIPRENGLGCNRCDDIESALREVVETEQHRALAYLGVLADNHPHLQDVYIHAQKNMAAMFKGDWQPIAAALRREFLE